MTTVETRNDLLRVLPQGMVIAELGVFIGQFSEIILSTCAPKELHLIDLWSHPWLRSGDKDGKNARRANLPKVYEELKQKYQDSAVVKLHKMTTRDALLSFSDGYFDFIYIDADHRCRAVYHDMELSFLKSKRFIGGHDYNLGSGVRAAVDRFCQEKNLTISHITNDGCPSFLIEKQMIKAEPLKS